MVSDMEATWLLAYYFTTGPARKDVVHGRGSDKASDLTGEKGEEEEFGRLIVRRHPALGRAVELDVRPAEVAGVKTVGDMVHLEYYEPGSGAGKELVVSAKTSTGCSRRATRPKYCLRRVACGAGHVATNLATH
jgi:hypothetical protein